MYVKLIIKTKAKKEEIVVLGEDRIAISVKEPAEQNLANTRVRELLARHFGVPTGKIRIISGHHHPHKIASVDIEKVDSV